MEYRKTDQPFLAVSIAICLLLVFAGLSSAQAASPTAGGFRIMEGEPSIHIPGKVFLIEFVDFYCPHCHLFDTSVLPKLTQEFGDKLHVHMIGYPVIPGKLPTAFESYEQANAMGKGQQMKQALFRTIHHDHIQNLDKMIQKALIQEVGLDVEQFEAGLQTGKPYQALQKSIEWGNRIQITSTPTIVLNGNMRIDHPSYENLRRVIGNLLSQPPAQKTAP